MNYRNLCFLCVFLACFPLAANADTIPGKSLTNGGDPVLQRDVARAILGYERKVAPQSKRPRIVDTTVMVEERAFKVDQTGKIIGKWVERWVIQRDDGTRQTYLIRFDAHGNTGTGFVIQPVTVKAKS